MNDLQRIVDELEEAAQLEGTELGELWSALAGLSGVVNYGSDEFKASWEREVREEHRRLKAEFKIVVSETQRTVQTSRWSARAVRFLTECGRCRK